jgi:hypothetical protein
MFSVSPAVLSPVSATVIPEAASIYLALVAWWDFEQNNAGAQFNDSHGTNHMIIVPTLPTSGLSGTGKVGRAFMPGHGTGYIAAVPYTNTNIRFPNSDFSFGGWVAGGNTGGWGAFIGGRLGSAAGGYQAYLNIDGGTDQVQFGASTDGSTITQVSSLISSDTTLQSLMICTFDRINNLIRIRVKRAPGTNVNRTAAFPSALYTGVTTVNFALNGGLSGDNTLFSGSRMLLGTPQWDSWFYCLKALSDAEVDYLYNASAGKNYAALLTDSGH